MLSKIQKFPRLPWTSWKCFWKRQWKSTQERWSAQVHLKLKRICINICNVCFTTVSLGYLLLLVVFHSWIVFCFRNLQSGQFLPFHSEDVSGLVARGSAEHLVAQVPLSSIRILRPTDMPCIEDWITCSLSFLFSGSRLHREPLDLNVQHPYDPAAPKDEPYLIIKKGFTRLLLDDEFSSVFS